MAAHYPYPRGVSLNTTPQQMELNQLLQSLMDLDSRAKERAAGIEAARQKLQAALEKQAALPDTSAVASVSSLCALGALPSLLAARGEKGGGRVAEGGRVGGWTR